MNKLISTALERLAKFEVGEGKYADDESFDVPGADLGSGQI